MSGLLLGLLGLLQLAIFLRALISWIQLPPDHPVIRALDVVCEPLLHPIRQVMGTAMSGIDFSPFVAIIALEILKRVVLRML